MQITGRSQTASLNRARMVGRGSLLLALVLFLATTISMMNGVFTGLREYHATEQREVALRVELTARQEALKSREAYFRLLMEDPAFLERVVRDKLNFIKPGERLYRFQESDRP